MPRAPIDPSSLEPVTRPLDRARTRPGAAATHPLADLKETFAYVWRKPDLLGAFCIAFLANLLAFPFVLGLLPYVAKEVYGVGQSGLDAGQIETVKDRMV